MTTSSISLPTIAPQAMRNSFEELICTPEEFGQLLYTKNYQFPPKVIVTGDLDLRDTTIIERLPKGLEVRGNLALVCLTLKSLSQLKVTGELYLRLCTSLESLSDVEVGGDFYLNECSLPSLFEDLKLGGDLHIIECTSLTSPPSWITTLGVRADGGTRKVHLESAGLSNEIIEKLRQTPAPGMQFLVPYRATLPKVKFPNLQAALSFWLGEAQDAKLATPNIMIDQKDDEKNVLSFLDLLTKTAEYENLETKAPLARRVLEVFHQMAQDPLIKSNAFMLIHHNLPLCSDRIISQLVEIESMIHVHKIEI